MKSIFKNMLLNNLTLSPTKNNGTKRLILGSQ